MVKDLSSNNLHFIGDFAVCCSNIHYTLITTRLNRVREELLNARYNEKTELVSQLESMYNQLLQERDKYK